MQLGVSLDDGAISLANEIDCLEVDGVVRELLRRFLMLGRHGHGLLAPGSSGALVDVCLWLVPGACCGGIVSEFDGQTQGGRNNIFECLTDRHTVSGKKCSTDR